MKSTKYICVAGDLSGVGKSTVCLGILGALHKGGVPLDKLAYIKPVTQCQSAQPVVRWCKENGVTMEPNPPVVFKHGVTYKVIDGELGTEAERLSKVVAAVRKVGKGKDYVLVDGVGFAAVGRCAGVSNAQVAAALNAPTILVSRPGVGGCIDQLQLQLAYYEKHNAKILGAVVNYKEEPGRHSIEKTSKYVTKYFSRELPELAMLGFIPPLESFGSMFARVCQIVRTEIEIPPLEKEESAKIDEFIDFFSTHFDSFALRTRVARFYREPSMAPFLKGDTAMGKVASGVRLLVLVGAVVAVYKAVAQRNSRSDA